MKKFYTSAARDSWQPHYPSGGCPIVGRNNVCGIYNGFVVVG